MNRRVMPLMAAAVLAAAGWTAEVQDISGTWEGPAACPDHRTTAKTFKTLRFEIEVDSAGSVSGRRVIRNQGQNTLHSRSSWKPPKLKLLWRAMDHWIGVNVELAKDGRMYGIWWTQIGGSTSEPCKVELRRVRD